MGTQMGDSVSFEPWRGHVSFWPGVCMLGRPCPGTLPSSGHTAARPGGHLGFEGLGQGAEGRHVLSGAGPWVGAPSPPGTCVLTLLLGPLAQLLSPPGRERREKEPIVEDNAELQGQLSPGGPDGLSPPMRGLLGVLQAQLTGAWGRENNMRPSLSFPVRRVPSSPCTRVNPAPSPGPRGDEGLAGFTLSTAFQSPGHQPPQGHRTR